MSVPLVDDRWFVVNVVGPGVAGASAPSPPPDFDPYVIVNALPERFRFEMVIV
jgi:hypothetical protein